MLTCPACGLGLPPQARFCARCGAPLPAPAGAPAAVAIWVLLLFWLGSCVALGVAAVYAVALVAPDRLLQGGDPSQLRAGAAAIAGFAAAVFVAQFAASIGLTTGRPWGRVLGTLVSVAWALTCVGLPVAVLAIAGIWRPLRREGQGGAG